jgi:NADH:ubiquinone oxidoreductase subunit K
MKPHIKIDMLMVNINYLLLLGYELILISFSINLVAFSNKTRVCLAGKGYQGRFVKTLAAPPNA